MSAIPPSTPFAPTNALGRQYYHPVTGAVFIPDFFHQFILPTIPERSVLPMQPLNWQFGVRPDRPFDVSPTRHPRTQGNPVSIPRWPRAKPKYPTAYYLEQLQFWEDGPLPEEEQTEDELHNPGLPRVLFKAVFEALLLILRILLAVGQVLFAAALPVFSTGKKVWKSFLSGRTCEFAASVLVATQIVRILPRMERVLGSGERGVWSSVPAPLYVIMIPNPNQWTRAAVLS